VNVIGNDLFIFGLGPFPELGVTGAAVGTILGTLWSLCVTLLYLKKKRSYRGTSSRMALI